VSFGISVLVWQHLVGVELYWVITPLAVILLLAVGLDYNLLQVTRFIEESQRPIPQKFGDQSRQLSLRQPFTS
jgi:uncharacterized membrane protein YdfJ with MMPL/SSD domain